MTLVKVHKLAFHEILVNICNTFEKWFSFFVTHIYYFLGVATFMSYNFSLYIRLFYIKN